MLLLRLSGHSGAGKTRLVNLLPKYGITCPKVIRYTSRQPRKEEIEGEDYYFRSREFIKGLPRKDFFVGPVRNMLQAFDLKKLADDLQNHGLVLIEIYPLLWAELISRLEAHMQIKVKTASIFLTAVDPSVIRKFRRKEEKAGYISSEVYKMLMYRNKDELEDVRIRAQAAAGEILEALSPDGRKMYNKIIHSAPEGPDGEDDWTREGEPVGNAKAAIEEFLKDFYSFTRAKTAIGSVFSL
jgi:guanylate kinase